MSVKKKLTAIADNIRYKTGKSEPLNLDGMAYGINEVYNAGQNATREAFWKKLQSDGARTNWQYAFYGSWWSDEMYNPIYPIKIGNNNTNMYYDANITDTKVSLDAGGTKLNYTFREAAIETIPELKVTAETDISNAFTNTAALKNITITGSLGKSVKMNACPLSPDSIRSIITALIDYTGTESEYVNTVTFKTSAFEALEDEGATAGYNGQFCTWAELIDNKKWNLVKA